MAINADSGLYAELNRKWKAVSRLIFGDEVGDMRDYEEWLSDIGSPRAVQRDAAGREIILSVPHYSRTTRFISFEEVDFEKRYPPLPLSVNDIKDIDSLLEAVSGRICYTGNIVLGNSKFVEKSTGIFESFFIYHSERSAYCKHLAYCTQATSSECMFGCNGFGSTSFCIKINGLMYSSRCLECSRTEYSSDCYYSHNLVSCRDCMFSFNLRNARHCIGNISLAPEKYAHLKAKLVSEMREMLLKNKRLPPLVEICSTPVPKQGWPGISTAKRGAAAPAQKPDVSPIQKAFDGTTRLIFGRPCGQIDRYGKWLNRCSARLEEGASSASGRRVLVPEYIDFLLFPRDRLVCEDEAQGAGESLKASPEALERLSMKNAQEFVSPIAAFCPHWALGTVKNCIDAEINFDSANCYKNVLNINSKYAAFGYWARDSEHVFGGNEIRNSSFCINCYHSAKLTRCLEVDASRDCSDCCFCHNCENVHDSMFCFNAKNLKYAIGNAEVGRESYLRIKAMLLARMNAELEKTGAIGMSIFTLLEKLPGANQFKP